MSRHKISVRALITGVQALNGLTKWKTKNMQRPEPWGTPLRDRLCGKGFMFIDKHKLESGRERRRNFKSAARNSNGWETRERNVMIRRIKVWLNTDIDCIRVSRETEIISGSCRSCCNATDGMETNLGRFKDYDHVRLRVCGSCVD